MSTAALQFHFKQRPIVVVMGVTGSGKSTIGAALALHESLPFLDADDYHPKANVDKMSAGIPLTDKDRWPWLSILGEAMRTEADQRGGVVTACSALKRAYRTHLSNAVGLPLLYVLLDGSRQTLFRRLSARKDHYMPVSLLDSQIETLERPAPDEPAIILSVEQDVDDIVSQIRTACADLSI